MATRISGKVMLRHGPETPGSDGVGAARIFVAVASYRDPECQWTIKDLFEKADDPSRVFAGICWQTVPEEDGDCFAAPSPRPEQTRSVQFHVSESQGVGWARSQAHKLWRGEEYLLNIDSHMRFVPGWDSRMIAILKACPGPKPVLTTYPPGYTPPDKLNPPSLPLLIAGYFDEAGVLVNKSRALAIEDAPSQPMPTMLYAAGFVFATSEILKEVPYDPYIYFQGEEIAMAARLWTHGWDLFAPNEVLLYHAYGQNAKRKTHWQDNRDWGQLNRRSRSRVAHLVGSQACEDESALKELETYGLGTARTLLDFERLSGIDFKARRISVSAGEGRFPLSVYDAEGEALRRVFTDHWQKNSYGNLETRSGQGSTLGATRRLRAWLSDALARLGVESLLDAGCGDAVWISGIAEKLALYVGIDIVDEQIAINARIHKGRGNMLFTCANILSDPLPRTDAILCRDTLTHLSDAQVGRALAAFRRTGASYLLATHFPNAAPRDVQPGGWRAINLALEPLALGGPRESFVEMPEAGKTLSIWQLQG